MVSLLIKEDWKFATRENGTNIVAHWATMRQLLPANSLDTPSFLVSHMHVHVYYVLHVMSLVLKSERLQAMIANHTGIITDERYGRSNSSYRHFGSIFCSNHGNESRLIDCTLSGTSNCSYIVPNCQSSERQTGLECFNGG